MLTLTAPFLPLLPLLCLLCLLPVTLSSLSVTPTPLTINSISTYQWTISSIPIPTPTNNAIVMQFPSSVVFDAGGSTAVQGWDGVVYGGTVSRSGSAVVVGLVARDQGNMSFVFRVTNVRNPAWKNIETVGFSRGASSLSATINYDKGPILACVLSF